jgi:predicted PurR-regulated permease PerM
MDVDVKYFDPENSSHLERPSMATEIHNRAAVQRNALVIVAVIVSGAAFYWLGAILTPLALALFLMVMIDSLARVLAKVPRFPRMAALPVAIVLAIVGFVLIAFMVADNAAAFAGQLLGDGPKFNARIASLAGAMHLAMPPTVDQLIQQLNPGSYLGSIVQGLQGFASNAVFVMIYLGFLLASRQGFERKTHGLFHSEAARHDAVIAFQRIRTGVERYLWVQAVACGIIALASWAVISVVGVQDALFWAFLIFLVGYVPVIGGAIGILLPPLFALVQFEDWWHAATLLAGLLVINFIVGNIVYPRMQGKSLNIDPLVILLSLAFWGAIWGLPGLFLSTPLTVAAMVILAQFPGSRWIAVLLSSDGHPLGEESMSEGGAAAIAEPVGST